MKFGPVPVDDAVGAFAAHSLKAGDLVLKKGSPISAEIAAALRRAGIETLVAARLDPTDIPEDEAAGRLAADAAGPGVRVEPPFTGRCNLFSLHDGVLVIDGARVDRVNEIDEAITLATLPAFKSVVAGEMVATVKIIPYAVPGEMLGAACREGAGLLEVRPFRRRRVVVVSTLTPGFKETIVDKTLRVLAERLRPAGAAIAREIRVAHETGALAGALREVSPEEADLVIVFGASAIADRRDVIPAAIEAAGGSIAQFGMPVDPGNLLLVGDLAGLPVVGAPGCARSPKENGFDWVLARLLADVPVTRRDVTRMGVGGLLMEIVSRPQPRAGGHPSDEPDE